MRISDWSSDVCGQCTGSLIYLGSRRPFPEQTWADGPAAIAREVGPAVAVEILPALPVITAGYGPAPIPSQRGRRITTHVLPVIAGRVEHNIGFRFRAGPPRHEVDDSAQRGRAIERGGGALDDFHLTEIGRRYLEQTDGRGLRSEEHTSELQSLMRISYAVFC